MQGHAMACKTSRCRVDVAQLGLRASRDVYPLSSNELYMLCGHVEVCHVDQRG